MPFIAPLGDGLRRVARAPMVLVGGAVLTAAVAAPPSLLLADGPAADGRGPAAGGSAPGCIPLQWPRFPAAEYAVDGRPCATGADGAHAAVLASLRALLDGEGHAPGLAAVVFVFLAAWALFSAGAIDRYARERPTRGAGFFAACGVYGPRLLRLGLISVFVNWTLFNVVRDWIVGAPPPGGGLPAAVLARYAAFGLLLAAVGLVFDYARVRVVVEDRRSMIGALLAGWRFVRRHPADCAGLYAVNATVLVGVIAAHAVAAPHLASAGASARWAVAAGLVYLAARLAGRLFFYATEVSYFQSRLAHAGYVAAPAPVWPESASAEALARLSDARGDGERGR